MIPHNKPTLGMEEEQAALRVIRSGWLAQGAEVEAFENEFCKFIGLPNGHAVAVSSGTAALYLALWVLGAYQKKITFPGYACSALRHAVAMAGGYEDLIDTTTDSPNIDIEHLKKESTDIIIIPHMFGIPVDFVDYKFTKSIEDCAQALGARVNGKSVGIQGTVGIFSFYATKLITSGGQGGMFVSRDKNLVDTVKDYREFDMRRDNKKRFNFQLTDLQAAIGREQLRKLPSFLSRRKEIFDQYKQSGLELLDISVEKKNLIPVRYRAIMRTKNQKGVIDSLESVGVKAIIPTEDWELLGDKGILPNGWILSKETVSLPIYPSLTDEDVRVILSGIIR